MKTLRRLLTSDAVKAKARELGFDLCGIAPVTGFPELSFLHEWLDRGYAGEMAWMQRTADRRADVRTIMPTAQSVIVTGTVYNTGAPYSTEIADPDVALISRYAWGDDYHDVLRRRLDQLLGWMQRESPEPFEARAYTDTGPVQERVYAQYAGLGWIGKNSCLIHPQAGSWLFLSEVICSIRLEPDRPLFDQCGSCTLCLEACPTGALTEPHVLDSRRCLSYLTIELRGDIPSEHRAAVGSHVYGCDVCQAVCPYNHAPAQTADGPWQPRASLDRPSLARLWLTSDRELRQAIRGSAITRAKITGLRRNIAVAIGNSGGPDGLAALEQPNDDRRSADDDMVQRHVDWALEHRRIGAPTH